MDHGLLMNDEVWCGRIFRDKWQSSVAGTFDVSEKATGKVLSQVGRATPEDVASAAQLVRNAQQRWVEVPFEERAAIFRRAAVLLGQKRDELAVWIMRESGAVRSKAEGELRSSISSLNFAASMLGEPQGLVLPSNPGRLSYAPRVPHGVVGITILS